ncbi:putative DnaJ domain-containing protein [Cyclospora cayetanensis]|nr:putative DnaJ domain-containing protein [Cyclospora cayetanensis]
MTRPCNKRSAAATTTSINGSGKVKRPKEQRGHQDKYTEEASSSSGKGKRVGEAETHSLYDLLGVSSDATPREITAAYRRRALVCHPDKVRQRERTKIEGEDGGKGMKVKYDDSAQVLSVEEATKHFQRLQAAYAVLSDPKKRERYDRTGETGEDLLEGKSYEEAYRYYREKFPEVTQEAIDQFKAKYLNSEEEKEDILDFVNKFRGDLTLFFDFIPLSEPSDWKRYKSILSLLLEEKKVKRTAALEETIRSFDMIAEKFTKKTKKEEKEAAKGGKKKMDTSSLALAILGNMSKREEAGNRFLSSLEEKYGKKKTRK